MKQQERKEDAASPVIGVMLMLVVTVVIAAVITVFATGMAGDSTSTTPMALIEADTPKVSGKLLQSFDLVHKGGDEMKLENLQVIIEPAGNSQNGIILERRGTGNINSDYEAQMDELMWWYNDYKNECGENNVLLKELSGTGGELSVPGKNGEDIVVSTGDRIRVAVKTIDEGATGGFALYYRYDEGDEWELDMTVPKYTIRDNERSLSDMKPGTLVKWTLSDVRTTGVIAKGEFVVPEK